MASLTYMQVLRGNRTFRRLWLGQVVSELGNWFNFIAGLGLVRAVSANAPEATAIMLMCRLAPFALISPIAGAFADRWSRRTVMLVTDLARVIVALGFLMVRRPEDLWIAYTCNVALTILGTFFEAAKNAATPNIVGDEGLLAGNALMFSSRFLLMTLGSVLGGWASARFGYHTAFLINSASFLVSAYSVWLVPERETRQEMRDEEAPQQKLWRDVREGWSYIAKNRLVTAIIGVNILWATGGGAVNLITDRLGGIVFAGQSGMKPDAAVAALYAASGAGLFLGMMFARRVGSHIELHRATVPFIGWTLITQGIFFALMGVLPTIWLACAMVFMSRIVIGVEFAYQETLIMRLVPDNLRGRVSTMDRSLEFMVWTVSTAIAGWSLHLITPRMLTFICGLLSASPGVVWLVAFASRMLKMPQKIGREEDENESEETVLASAG
ncbi:MAG TPA: MFS transporter [Pyrinomonadaceae bacterium]|nr:MFS transporter [Pyrinomonadaceae bacterium]